MVEIDQCLSRVLNWKILVNFPKVNINLTTPSCQHHLVFHSFLYDDRKKYAATTTAPRKRLV